MTVYNITTLAEKKVIDALKIKYNLNKIIFCYSDFLNDFGLRTIPKLTDKKIKDFILNYLIKKTDANHQYISNLMKYPEITGKPRIYL